jgi:ketosteroid isomerase-like protein
MASANLDLVQSIYAAWERGDFSSTDWADPEIEHVFVDGPEPGSLTGLAGMAEISHTIFSAFDDYRVEAEEYRELGAERVLVLTAGHGHGKTSGVPFAQKTVEVFEIHNGIVTRIVVYNDRDRAFADLGLTPDAGT